VFYPNFSADPSLLLLLVFFACGGRKAAYRHPGETGEGLESAEDEERLPAVSSSGDPTCNEDFLFSLEAGPGPDSSSKRNWSSGPDGRRSVLMSEEARVPISVVDRGFVSTVWAVEVVVIVAPARVDSSSTARG